MEKTNSIVGVIGGSLAIVAIIVGAATYFLNLEWRLRSVEARLLTITSEPTTTTKTEDRASPLADACAQASAKLSASIERLPVGFEVTAFKDQLKLLGCDKLIQEK